MSFANARARGLRKPAGFRLNLRLTTVAETIYSRPLPGLWVNSPSDNGYRNNNNTENKREYINVEETEFEVQD